MKNTENNINVQKTKKTNYSPQSGSIVFMLALFLPTVVTSIYALIVRDVYQNDFTYYFALALMQLTFFAIYFAYNKLGEYDAIKCSKIKFNLNILQVLLIVAISLIGLYSFSPLVNLYQGLLQKWGYSATFSHLNLSNFGYFILNICIVGILPCICEELIFRGVILNSYSKYKKWVGVVLSAVMFMIMHLSIDQTIYQLFLGVILALVVMETGSIFSSIILHGVNNIVILFTNYIYNINGVSTSGGYDFTPWNCIYPILLAILGAIICVLLIKLVGKLNGKKVFKNFKFYETESQQSNKTLNCDVTINETESQQLITTDDCKNDEKDDCHKKEDIIDFIQSQNGNVVNNKKVEKTNETYSQLGKQENFNESSKLKGLSQGSSDAYWIILGLAFGVIMWIVSVIL